MFIGDLVAGHANRFRIVLLRIYYYFFTGGKFLLSRFTKLNWWVSINLHFKTTFVMGVYTLSDNVLAVKNTSLLDDFDIKVTVFHSSKKHVF